MEVDICTAISGVDGNFLQHYPDYSSEAILATEPLRLRRDVTEAEGHAVRISSVGDVPLPALTILALDRIASVCTGIYGLRITSVADLRMPARVAVMVTGFCPPPN